MKIRRLVSKINIFVTVLAGSGLGGHRSNILTEHELGNSDEFVRISFLVLLEGRVNPLLHIGLNVLPAFFLAVVVVLELGCELFPRNEEGADGRTDLLLHFFPAMGLYQFL